MLPVFRSLKVLCEKGEFKSLILGAGEMALAAYFLPGIMLHAYDQKRSFWKLSSAENVCWACLRAWVQVQHIKVGKKTEMR